MRHAPIAVARKIEDQPLNGITQGEVFCAGSLPLGVLLPPTATHPKQGAESPHRHLWLAGLDLRHHGVSLRERTACKAFCNTWFSQANWPQKRSSSAIRASGEDVVLLPAVNACSPCC